MVAFKEEMQRFLFAFSFVLCSLILARSVLLGGFFLLHFTFFPANFDDDWEWSYFAFWASVFLGGANTPEYPPKASKGRFRLAALLPNVAPGPGADEGGGMPTHCFVC